jgi:hypothetical protein
LTRHYETLVLVIAPLAMSLASCTSETITSDTYSDEFGGVWYSTDCPDADVLLSGGADGLPAKGQTDLDQVEAAVGDSGRSSVIPRDGEVWEKEADGTITVTSVHDYMINTTIDKASECPTAPVSSNGVPVAYKIAGD